MAKVRVKISPAKYLSPTDIQAAKQISTALRISKDVDDIIQYQGELNNLIKKAVVKQNIRDNADLLKNQAKQKINNPPTVN